MERPLVVEVDANAPQTLSPLIDYTSKHRGDELEPKKSTKQAVDMKHYKELSQKYKDTKAKFERLKTESTNNKKMLLEISSVINALKDISVEYEYDESSSEMPLVNIQKKIRAIDEHMKTCMLQCDHLEQEKELQSSTIKAQECQIKTMEKQVLELREQLKKAVSDKKSDIDSEKEELDRMQQNGELASTIEAQETKISHLEEQLRKYTIERNSAMSMQIEVFRGSNQAKMLEIEEMEKKLQMLRDAQQGQLVVGEKLPQRRVTFKTEVLNSQPKRKGSSVSSEESSQSSSSADSASKPSLETISEESSAPSASENDIYAEKPGDYDFAFQLDRSKSRSSDCSVPSYCSSTTGKESLGAISEDWTENDDGSNGENRHPTDPEGSKLQVRSYSKDDPPIHQDGKEESSLHNIKIQPLWDDESVEILFTDYQSSSVDTTAAGSHGSNHHTRTPGTLINFEDEYNKAMNRLEGLQKENERLRQNHGQALSNMAQISVLASQLEKTKAEYVDLKRSFEEQKQLATMVNTKYVKLSQQHSKTMEELSDEKEKYDRLMNDHSKAALLKKDLEDYEKLQQLHENVVMKLADISEENECLQEDKKTAIQEREEADLKHKQISVELEATRSAFTDLQRQNDHMASKVNKLSVKCEEFKTKYYELLSCDSSLKSDSGHSGEERYEFLRREYEMVLEKLQRMEDKSSEVEKLKREHSEALAKITVLEQCNQELENVREELHAAEAKVTLLKRTNKEVTDKIANIRTKDKERACHLKDMIGHYKILENQHEDVCQKLKRLQAIVSGKNNSKDANDGSNPLQQGPDGPKALADLAKDSALHTKVAAYEQRIKNIQQERDSAIEQMTQLEEELFQVRLEKVEATKARKEREQDLKVVLGHYKELQQDYKDLQSKVDRLETELMAEAHQQHLDTVHTTRVVLAEQEGEQGVQPFSSKPQNNVVGQDQFHRVDEAEDMISEAAPEDEVPPLCVGNSSSSTADDESMAASSYVAGKEEMGETKSALVPVSEQEREEQEEQNTNCPEVQNDEDSVVQLLIDMEELRQNLEMDKECNKKTDKRTMLATDVSTVSNVSEGLSLDGSEGGNDDDGEEGTAAAASVLSDEAPSTGWKDVKIAQLIRALEDSKKQVEAVQNESQEASRQLQLAEEKVLVAQRQADEAQQRQLSRERQLRDVVAQQKQWQDDYERTQEELRSLQQQLEQAQKEARLAQEESKTARQRATSYHHQFKKLQEKHSEALKMLEDQERQIDQLTEASIAL